VILEQGRVEIPLMPARALLLVFRDIHTLTSERIHVEIPLMPARALLLIVPPPGSITSVHVEIPLMPARALLPQSAGESFAAAT
jgi:hypothetical protein